MNLKHQKGISILIVVVCVALILVLAFGFYFYVNSNQKNKITELPNLEGVVSDYIFLEKKVETNLVNVTHMNSLYARAQVQTGLGNQSAFLMLRNGEWQVVSLQQEIPFCERLEALGFPTSMIFDCLLEFPDAISVSSAKEKIVDVKKGEVVESQIIGQLQVPSDPGLKFFEISDDDETIQITYDITQIDPSDFGDINSGDILVIDTEISNDEEGDTEIKAKKITKINDEENQEEEQNSQEDSDLSEEIYYDITDLPPNVAPPDEDFFKLLFDRDFSNQDVRIISDF